MIASTANQKVKRIVQLNKKPSQRRKEKVFVAEGLKMFLEAPEEYLEEVYISESFLHGLERSGFSADSAIFNKLKRNGYEVAADEVFVRMSDTQTPQGVLCVAGQRHYTLDQMLCSHAAPDAPPVPPHFLILENLQDPGNLGTIMRTGEGAGITGIIMSRDTADIYNPKTIRATMGSVYRVPFLYTDDMEETLRLMKERGITLYAAHLEGKRNYDMCDYRSSTAFLIGNEGSGLSEPIAALADTYIKIPMEGDLESLNAAVAASLLMYEAARQRRGS